MECRDRWADDGRLVLERDFKGKDYPNRLPLELAYDWYRYGDQRKQFWPMYNFPDGVKRIPDNVTPDWVKQIQGLFFDMGRTPLSAVKIVCLGQEVKSLGVHNAHTFAAYDRMVNEWIAAQKAIDEFCANREGWKHLTSANLQNPEHGKEMSKVLDDILAKADEMVGPSYNAIREQDRRMYARQDATYARNNVKSLGGFFEKYSEPVPECLTLVGGIIDDIESRLTAKK
jgi:hypothetical protein